LVDDKVIARMAEAFNGVTCKFQETEYGDIEEIQRLYVEAEDSIGSCMTGKDQTEKVKFYGRYDVKLQYFTNKGTIQARRLVWRNSDGVEFGDRIYSSTPALKEQFPIIKNPEVFFAVPKKKFSLKIDPCSVPYIDSLLYLDLDNGTLCNNYSHNFRCWTNCRHTNGGTDHTSFCSECGEIFYSDDIEHDNPLCESCEDSCRIHCAECGCSVRDENVFNVGGLDFCSRDCAEDSSSVFECSECGDLTHEDYRFTARDLNGEDVSFCSRSCARSYGHVCQDGGIYAYPEEDCAICNPKEESLEKVS
jgi:hypothetical protein